jgi:hypothetical protein
MMVVDRGQGYRGKHLWMLLLRRGRVGRVLPKTDDAGNALQKVRSTDESVGNRATVALSTRSMIDVQWYIFAEGKSNTEAAINNLAMYMP